MEQLSFFQNNPSNQRLRRSVSSVRDRVDRTVSNAKVTETSRLPHLEIPSSRSVSISKARASLSNGKTSVFNSRATVSSSSDQATFADRVGDVKSIKKLIRGRQFIPHENILNTIERALIALRIDLDEVEILIDRGLYGAQMSLVISLPAYYDYDPGYMDAFKLQLVFHNCVSRGGLRVLARWCQEETGVTCSVGVTQLNASLAHRIPAREEQILPTFRRAIDLANDDRIRFDQWLKQDLKDDLVQTWISESVRRMWGTRGKNEIQKKIKMQSSKQTIFNILISLAEYSINTRDILKQCDQVVEGAVLIRSLLKRKGTTTVQ